MKTQQPARYNFYIVDKDQKDLEFIQNAIKDTLPGARIKCFSEGNQMIESLYQATSEPDLILVDCEKDKNIAKEALTLIKQNEFFFLIPVIALGRYLTREEKNLLNDIGVDVCCQKPSTERGMKNIIKKISGALKGNRLERPSLKFIGI
jgi:response regulator RpfG family c-di-GMP phosphodiesterase